MWVYTLTVVQLRLLIVSQYSWLGTILYLGVLAGEYPTNLLLQKLPVAKYLAAKSVESKLSEDDS